MKYFIDQYPGYRGKRTTLYEQCEAHQEAVTYHAAGRLYGDRIGALLAVLRNK